MTKGLSVSFQIEFDWDWPLYTTDCSFNMTVCHWDSIKLHVNIAIICLPKAQNSKRFTGSCNWSKTRFGCLLTVVLSPSLPWKQHLFFLLQHCRLHCQVCHSVLKLQNVISNESNQRKQHFNKHFSFVLQLCRSHVHEADRSFFSLKSIWNLAVWKIANGCDLKITQELFFPYWFFELSAWNK